MSASQLKLKLLTNSLSDAMLNQEVRPIFVFLLSFLILQNRVWVYGSIACYAYKTKIFSQGRARHILFAHNFRIPFTSNGKRDLCTTWPTFPFSVVYCSLLLLRNYLFHAIFIHLNCSELFLSAYILFWEIFSWILILNLTFAICRDSKSLYFFSSS